MQRTIYECDRCKKEIGKNIHISLHLERDSGIAIPPGSKTDLSIEERLYETLGDQKWTLKILDGQKIIHFCNPNCLSLYFADLIKRSNPKKNKK